MSERLPFPKDISVEELCKVTAERLGVKVIGRVIPGAVDSARDCRCTAPWCQNKIEGFRDKGSMNEYMISGLCQSCQDEAFGE